MALRPIQLCIVFTIGFHLATATQERKTLLTPTLRLSVELKDPKDVIVAKGQSASLACPIQATKANVDLVWIYNGSKIPLNDSRWEFLDNGTLYIPKVTGKRMNSVEGLYQCLVKNSVGSLLSKTAKLSIATLGEEFQEQPTNLTVQEGRSAVLPCKIDSFPSGIVTWRHNNLTLPQTARYVPLPSGSLLITSTLLSDSGSYSCNVVNPILRNKAKESDIGWLTVTPLPPRASDDFAAAPVFLPLSIRRNITALVGNNVTLYCAGDGWPLPTLTWVKDASSVSLGNSSVLTLRNVTAKTTGKYICIAKNRLGFTKQTYYLDIQQPPYFNSTLESKTYVTPVTLRIQCNAFGIPEPKVHWLKNGEMLNYNVRQRNQSSTLIISNSVTQDMGFYQCVAENSAGKSWIAAQYVPSYLTADISPPSNVKCRPYNDTSICINWSPSESATAYVVYHFYPGAATEMLNLTNLTYLMLENLNKSTNYTIYARAFTSKVSDQSEHILCQTGIIGKRNLTLRLHNNRSLELNWSRISTDVSCDGSFSDYRLQWRRSNQVYSNVEYVRQSNYYIYVGTIEGLGCDDVDCPRVVEIAAEEEYEKTCTSTDDNITADCKMRAVEFWTGSKSRRRSISSISKFGGVTSIQPIYNYLQPSVQYQFRVTSLATKNADIPWIDFQMPEHMHNVTAPIRPINPEIFNTAPYNLKAEYIASNSINLSWSYNDKNIAGFMVCQAELNPNRNCQLHIESALTKLNVENLRPGTAYEFKVQAKHDNGSLSDYSKIIEIHTLSKILDSHTIQDVKHLPLNSSSVCLRWRAPRIINGTRIKYTVSYKNASAGVIEKIITTSQHCWIPPSFGDDIFQTQLTKLNPKMMYNVSIISEYQNASKIYWIIVSTRKINNTIDGEEDDIYKQQKLGFILGIAISLCGVLSCISCLVYSLKKRKCTNTASPCRAIYYNADGNATTIFGNCQARHQESCAADTQEMQNLIGENGMCHIPSVTPNNLDTKGGIDFPNIQANGSVHHPSKTGYIPNGHVHITVNPQFYIPSQNQNKHSESEPMLHPTQDDSYEEDSNSNLQNTKLHKFLFHETNQPENMKKLSSMNLCESANSSIESSLNATQLTTLDESGISPMVYRKISIPLAPNG